MDCAAINAMLATQRALQTQLTAQVEIDQVADALATVQLNAAQAKKTGTMATLQMHQQQLQSATMMIEQLSMMHAAMMC